MSISFNSNILAGSPPYKSKFALALIHPTAALKSPPALHKRNMDFQMATAKDSAEALNEEWWSQSVLQFYIIICLPLSSKEKRPSWKHFSSRPSGRSGPQLKSMSSAGTSAHAGPAQPLLFLPWPGRANKLPGATFSLLSAGKPGASLSWGDIHCFPHSLLLHWSMQLISAALQNCLPCPWRFQNSGPGWCEGLISLLGMGQFLCRAALFVFRKDKTVGRASQRMSSFTESSPSTLIFWDGFSSSSFYSTPSQLSLVS